MQETTAKQASSALPLLAVVLGLPGTGKTTFAAALAKRLGAAHLNTDLIREELGLKGQYSEAARSLVYQAMAARAEAALLDKQPVVVDGTFYLPALRAPYRKMGEKFGIRPCWIQIAASEAAVRRRVARKRQHSEADFNVYLRIRDAWEPLEDEHLELSSEENLEEMVGKALDYLRIQNSGP